ncbi:hypothetical protein [Streptomyces sp. NPDC006307]|uniref:hypothetical protein n=1 Tax=Streptomyces sp. NPDC006307 TaxID=3156748 RepID=UPI0033AE4BF1
MSRAAPGPHPHPLIPAGDEWWHGCGECRIPIQGGSAGLVAHRRTVHAPPPRLGDRRTPITIQFDF